MDNPSRTERFLLAISGYVLFGLPVVAVIAAILYGYGNFVFLALAAIGVATACVVIGLEILDDSEVWVDPKTGDRVYPDDAE